MTPTVLSSLTSAALALRSGGQTSASAATAWGSAGQPTLRDVEPGAFARELMAQQPPEPTHATPPSPPPRPADACRDGTPIAVTARMPEAEPGDAAASDEPGTDDEPESDETLAAGGHEPPRPTTARATADRWRRGAPGQGPTGASAATTDEAQMRAEGAGIAGTPAEDPPTAADQAEWPPGVLPPGMAGPDAARSPLNLQRSIRMTRGDAAGATGVAADTASAGRGGGPGLDDAAGSTPLADGKARSDAVHATAARGAASLAAAAAAGAVGGSSAGSDAASNPTEALAGAWAASGQGPAGPALTTLAAGLTPFAADLTRAAQALAPQGARHEASAEVERRIHTPVTSTEFPTRISTELAVLARDGVQEARLHVSPEALGPIAVQIRLEGTAAQVNLAADNPLTRQVLEQSMPTLAAALREGGLTLTGGGVFQQAPQSGREGSPDGGRPGSSAWGRGRGRADADDSDAAVLSAAAPRRTRLPGQVDLYA